MLSEIDTSACILFLGSGFSANGKNILGRSPPVGDALRKDLIELLKDTSYQDYDLQVVSEAAATSSSIDLYQELYNRFTIAEISNEQKTLLSLPWRRIYTTNYDDTIELICPKLNTYNYDEPVPRRIALGSIVHLHGVIRSANVDNVSNQLVLGELSYVRQHLEKSPWLVELDRDVRFADNTFFFGYSLRDQHIAALLLKNPATKEKIFFISKGSPDTPTRTRLEQYGRIWPIAFSDFTNTLQNSPKPSLPGTPSQLKSLRYLDPLQDKAAATPPTAPEIRNLLAFGSFNFKRMTASLSNQDYVVNRDRLIERAVKSLEVSRTLVVDARLGNGKTIFLHVLGAARHSAQQDTLAFSPEKTRQA